MHHITSATLVGIEAVPVSVEADVGRGLSAFHLTGLPDASIREAKDRIRVAMTRGGYAFPRTRITVNLGPADVRKQGPLYDLPIAIALMLSQGAIASEAVRDAVIVGELSLDGRVRPVNGALAIALMARRAGFARLFVPEGNAEETACIPELDVHPVPDLGAIVAHLEGREPIAPAEAKPRSHGSGRGGADLSEIKGQALAKRGLEIAAAGGHNVLLKGPPGTGKTLLARAIPGILPALTHEEALEVTSIASVAGMLAQGSGLLSCRPFRTPHHSCSAASLIGGGTVPRPGEVSLAHRGVLFLDELPEFSRHVLEHLRGPLEDGEVTIARAAANARFPSRFLLVAAMNPCPCGHATDPRRECTCAPRAVSMYRKRLSGPLIDRFDLIIEVPSVETDKLLSQEAGESSADVRTRIERIRKTQRERFAGTDALTNAEMEPAQIKRWCALDEHGESLVRTAMDAHALSARGYVRVLKVARTIADLAGEKTIKAPHIAEALQYRLDVDDAQSRA